MAADTASAIFRRVLVPAVTGDAIVIERPFGRARAFAAAEAFGGLERASGVDAIDRELGAGTLERGEEAVVRRIRRLAPADPTTVGPRVDGSVVALAALFHDLVAAFHPDLDGVFRRDASHTLLDATARALAEIPPPSTVRVALLRHAWLGDLLRFSLVRTDVRWWVGGATFVGRTPPKRLLAWPELRRVRRDERSVEILRATELFGERSDLAAIAELHARAVTAFLAASPLTDLALAGRLAPAFRWNESVARLVASSVGARIARRAIALGEEGGRFAREVIASAIEQAKSAGLAGAGDAAAALL